MQLSRRSMLKCLAVVPVGTQLPLVFKMPSGMQVHHPFLKWIVYNISDKMDALCIIKNVGYMVSRGNVCTYLKELVKDDKDDFIAWLKPVRDDPRYQERLDNYKYGRFQEELQLNRTNIEYAILKFYPDRASEGLANIDRCLEVTTRK